MTWYLPFKISIAKTDVFAIECLDQIAIDYSGTNLLFFFSFFKLDHCTDQHLGHEKMVDSTN